MKTRKGEITKNIMNVIADRYKPWEKFILIVMPGSIRHPENKEKNQRPGFRLFASLRPE